MSFSQQHADLPHVFVAPAPAPHPELIDALRRPVSGADWGLWKTTILGVASFGLLPLLIWPSQFREFTTTESHQLGALANWARHGRAPDRLSSRLARAAQAVEASALFGLLPMLLALYVLALFVIQFTHQSFELNTLLDMTYRVGAPLRDEQVAPVIGVGLLRFGMRSGISLHAMWCIALSAGYILHWAQVRMHAGAVQRYARMFHRTLRDEAMPPLRSVWRCAGIWPLGIVAGVAFARFDAWWGIPMLFAAASQRRYMWQTSRTLRASLAARVGYVSTSPDGAVGAGISASCPMRGCGAQLRAHARFCPRCGVRVGPVQTA